MSVANLTKPAALVVLGLLTLAPTASARPVRGGGVESFLCRLGPIAFGWKAGCSLDPSGKKPLTKEGCSIDSSGRCTPNKSGCSIDPNGRCTPNKSGCSLDPNGLCQPQ